MSLATKKMAQRYRRLSKAPTAASGAIAIAAQGEDDDVDLFNRDRLRSVLRHRLKLKTKKSASDKKAKAIEEHEMQEKPLDKNETARDERELPMSKLYQPSATKGPVSEQPSTRPLLSISPSPRAITPEHESPKSMEAPTLARTTSAQSHKSNKSAKSNKSGNSKRAFPTFDPPAPVQIDSDDEDEGYEDHAFDHPSTYQDQVWIWVPQDTLGFSEIIVEDLKAAKVEASSLGASMDGKGTVEVTRNPPDEEWAGGHDS